jgi:hypothetical protein
MPRGVAAVLVAAACALLLAAPSGASPGAQYGIQDDAWLMYGPGTLEQRLTTLDRLGVRLVRFTVRWDQVAPTRPAAPRDPADPAYAWGQFEAVLRALRTNGVTPVVTLYGSPKWANGGHPPNWLPLRGVADFAYAAAKRFPWVRMWTMWNEPNGRTFAVPVSPGAYVQRVLNPGYASLHAANRANVVAGGVTSPRKTPTGMSPVAFMAGMRAAGARLDAYAQNPYPVSRGETPYRATCSSCTYLTLAKLPEIRAVVTRYFGASTRLWLTEYGYQTNPPDRLLGVSYALQAAYVGQAAFQVWRNPGVTMLIHFLVRDEPRLGGWQSGLFTVSGTAKLAYAAFGLPLAQMSRLGSRVVLWGQVRPGSGLRPYALQKRVGARWVTIGGPSRTDATGTFRRTAALARGTIVRVWALEAGYASPPLRVS